MRNLDLDLDFRMKIVCAIGSGKLDGFRNFYSYFVTNWINGVWDPIWDSIVSQRPNTSPSPNPIEKQPETINKEI